MQTASRRLFSSAAAASKQDLQFIRQMGPLGRASISLKSHVPETQKFFTSNVFATGAGNALPTYIKKNGDNFVMLVTFGLLGSGFLVYGSGMKDMLFGTGKKTQ